MTVDGVRFEIPAPTARCSPDSASRDGTCRVWTSSTPRAAHLATLLPLDKTKNADARRRVLDPEPEIVPEPAPSRRRAAAARADDDYAATGLPPAYVPATKHEPIHE